MNEPLVKNAEDKKQVANADQFSRGREGRILAALNFVMQSQTGRQLVKWIMDESELTSARQGNDNALQYLAGKSYIGAAIWQRLEKLDPALTVAMLTEARRERK